MRIQGFRTWGTGIVTLNIHNPYDKSYSLIVTCARSLMTTLATTVIDFYFSSKPFHDSCKNPCTRSHGSSLSLRLKIAQKPYIVYMVFGPRAFENESLQPWGF